MTARSTASLINKNGIPENACAQEKSIHAFLDAFGVHEFNVKNLIEDKAKIVSPIVEKLMREKKSKPNLKERRLQ